VKCIDPAERLWSTYVLPGLSAFTETDDDDDSNGSFGSNDLEELLSLRMMTHFIKTQQLLPMVPVFQKSPQDEELYLSAVIALCKLLQKFATHIAAVQPQTALKSVKIIYEKLVQPVQGQLLKFDFRNGPLRRKYDGVKYCSKNLEELIYQLSFFDTKDPAQADEGVTDKNEFSIDFESLRVVIEKFDQTRDEVIKKSRDITKAGKNAVYSCLRGNLKEAEKLIANGEKIAVMIAEKELKEEPSLRTSGSYTAGLEELGEAQFLLSWLTDRTLRRHPLLNDTETLGALGDFTGEVHRWAVGEATKRVRVSVQEALLVVTEISQLFLDVHLPGKVVKKCNQLHSTLSKEETLLFELNLSAQKKARS